MINYLLDRPLKNVYLGGFLDFGAKKETNDVLLFAFIVLRILIILH